MRLRAVAAAAGALLAAAGVTAAPAGAASRLPGCASAGGTGGDWRSYGHDYSNTRTQPDENVISAGDVPTLAPAWTFSTKEVGAEGDFTGTPVIADGCMYLGSTRGWVIAQFVCVENGSTPGRRLTRASRSEVRGCLSEAAAESGTCTRNTAQCAALANR